MTTGQRIKKLRKDLSLSAEKLAVRLNVPPATVYRWEKGDIEKVPMTILPTLAEALHTTPEYIMGWSDEQPDTEKQVTLQTEEARILAMGFDRMPEAERKRALDMAKLIFAAYADQFDEKGINDDDERRR
jgi:transcriptional regulator with XRE-family HTH domain